VSCYNWERGTISIPTKYWASLKESLRVAYNRKVQQKYDLALRIQEALISVLKGRRGLDWHGVVTEEHYRRSKLTAQEQAKLTVLLGDADLGFIADRLFPKDKATLIRRSRPIKPKKKDFPFANTKTMSYRVGYDAQITLQNETKMVTWDVDENNHAVERSREHYLAGVLFSALERVVWTRRTGGSIVGNDEYNRDSEDEGGAANYVTFRFGADQKRYEDQFKTKRKRVRR
jgi:hypothetical protein